MTRRVSVTVERFPLRGAFTISRGSKTEAVVVRCEVEEDGVRGQGECVPYPRYGETPDEVAAVILGHRSALQGGASREDLQHLLPPGAARNAVDCALWDLEAKRSGTPVAERLGLSVLRPVDTAYTISLGTPGEMEAAARAASGRTVLKVKVGASEGDVERMRAVRRAAPRSRLVIDANEGWRDDDLERYLDVAAEIGALMVEQPLPAKSDAVLARIERSVPVCADESVHGTGDLEALRERYDWVNLKLDKTGGLTEGAGFLSEAERLGFGVMVGCMVGTSLAMAPAVLLAQRADLADLDGPLLLREDRPNGLLYEGSTVAPPTPELWG